MPLSHTQEEFARERREKSEKSFASRGRGLARKRDLWLELVSKVKSQALPLGRIDVRFPTIELALK